LVHADGVGVGDDLPIVGVPVDAGDHVGRELEDLERGAGPVERGGGQAKQEGEQDLFHELLWVTV